MKRKIEYLIFNIEYWKKLAIKSLMLLISLYQATLSRWLGGHCRFIPTCSEYAKEVIARFGPFKGSWLAMKRLLRCNPCCRGGYDASGN